MRRRSYLGFPVFDSPNRNFHTKLSTIRCFVARQWTRRQCSHAPKSIPYPLIIDIGSWPRQRTMTKTIGRPSAALFYRRRREWDSYPARKRHRFSGIPISLKRSLASRQMSALLHIIDAVNKRIVHSDERDFVRDQFVFVKAPHVYFRFRLEQDVTVGA